MVKTSEDKTFWYLPPTKVQRGYDHKGNRKRRRRRKDRTLGESELKRREMDNNIASITDDDYIHSLLQEFYIMLATMKEKLDLIWKCRSTRCRTLGKPEPIKINDSSEFETENTPSVTHRETDLTSDVSNSNTICRHVDEDREADRPIESEPINIDNNSQFENNDDRSSANKDQTDLISRPKQLFINSEPISRKETNYSKPESCSQIPETLEINDNRNYQVAACSQTKIDSFVLELSRTGIPRIAENEYSLLDAEMRRPKFGLDRITSKKTLPKGNEILQTYKQTQNYIRVKSIRDLTATQSREQATPRDIRIETGERNDVIIEGVSNIGVCESKDPNLGEYRSVTVESTTADLENSKSFANHNGKSMSELLNENDEKYISISPDAIETDCKKVKVILEIKKELSGAKSEKRKLELMKDEENESPDINTRKKLKLGESSNETLHLKDKHGELKPEFGILESVFKGICFHKLKKGECSIKGCRFQHDLDPVVENLEQKEASILRYVIQYALQKGFDYFIYGEYPEIIKRMNYVDITKQFITLSCRKLMNETLGQYTIDTLTTIGISLPQFLRDISEFISKDSYTVERILRAFNGEIKPGAYWTTCRPLLIKVRPTSFILQKVIEDCIHHKNKLILKEVYENYMTKLSTKVVLSIDLGLRNQFDLLIMKNLSVRMLEHLIREDRLI